MNQKINITEFLKKAELELSFKGERPYLQGPDIIHELSKHIGEAKNCMFQLHRMSSHVMTAYWVSEQEVAVIRRQGPCVLAVYQINDPVKQYVVVTDDSSKTIDSRIPYDESCILQGSIIQDQTINQDSEKGGNFFERVVSLNKSLLNEIVENHPWVFSRIDLKKLPAEAKAMTVSLINNIGSHTYKSSIQADGELIGHLYFTRRSS